MRKKIHIRWLIAWVAGMLLFISCENEIAVGRKNFSPKLTLNSFIHADSLSNRLYLSLTGQGYTDVVNNVVVEVRVNDELKEVLTTVNKEGNSRYVIVTTNFVSGDRVRIDVRTNDGEHHAWIEETVPHRAEVIRIDTLELTHPSYPYYTYKDLRVKVRMKDLPNRKNYYRVVLEKRETVRGIDEYGGEVHYSFNHYDYWPWEDVALTDGRPVGSSEELGSEFFERVTNYYGIFDNSWFKESEYTLSVQVPFSNTYYSLTALGFRPERVDVDLAVLLLTITEAEYYYLNVMNIIDSDILEEYINDPIKIPSNVNGGVGMVGISVGYGEVIPVVKDKEVEYYD